MSRHAGFSGAAFGSLHGTQDSQQILNKRSLSVPALSIHLAINIERAFIGNRQLALGEYPQLRRIWRCGRRYVFLIRVNFVI
jgi:hypothetical protein